MKNPEDKRPFIVHIPVSPELPADCNCLTDLQTSTRQNKTKQKTKNVKLSKVNTQNHDIIKCGIIFCNSLLHRLVGRIMVPKVCPGPNL